MPPIPSDGVGRLRGDKLKVSVDVERLMRSVMMLTLKFDVQLANRQEHALRDIRMSAELISARRGLSMELQTASAGSSLQRIGQAARIGPNQTGTIRGQLQMPIGDFEVFRQGQIPFCVPILLLRLEAEGIEPQHHTFLIGLAPTQPDGRVQPLPLSGPPGGYDGVIAKRLERTS